jgi:hypothetical protein
MHMTKKTANIFPSADGLIILTDSASVSSAMFDYCANHTFREILQSPYKKAVDPTLTRLLYTQTSPIYFRLQPSRFLNELQDNKALMRAINKYKHRYKDTICTYTNDHLENQELPEFAKKLGVRFRLEPHFLRVQYDPTATPDKRIFLKGRLPSQSLFCSVSKENFDIVFNKIVPVISTLDAPHYHKASEDIQSFLTDSNVSEDKLEKRIFDYIKQYSPLEQKILKYIYFESDDVIDLKSSVAHELKHVINEILISARRAKPSCGKLNARQMMLTFIHDEISASSQEVFHALKEIYNGRCCIDDTDLFMLVPVHYLKYSQGSKRDRANILDHPRAVVKEVSQNWLKQNYDFYQKQFKDLFENLESEYPSALWSNDPNNDPKEYLLQKRMLYSLETIDPHTGKTIYVNCADAVDDSMFEENEALKESIQDTNLHFEQQESLLEESGITPQVIDIARRRNFDYCVKQRNASANATRQVVEKTLYKYMACAQKDKP